MGICGVSRKTGKVLLRLWELELAMKWAWQESIRNLLKESMAFQNTWVHSESLLNQFVCGLHLDSRIGIGWCERAGAQLVCDEYHGFDLVQFICFAKYSAVHYEKLSLFFQFVVPSLYSLAARGQLLLFINCYYCFNFTSEDTKKQDAPKCISSEVLQRHSQTQVS